MSRPTLRVLVVAPDADTASFAERVLSDHGDTASVADGVPDALSLLSRETFDVAVVSLSLPRGDGLALVHHLRALHPGVDVIVMAQPAEIEESAHAMALGVLASVVLPLSGDGLMVPVDRARERRVLIAERERLRIEGEESRRRSATYARCAAFVAETDAAAVASRVLDACVAEVGATGGAVYLASPAGDRLFRASAVGEESFPDRLEAAEIESIDPAEVVRRSPGRVRVALVGEASLAAVVDLAVEGEAPLDDGPEGALRVVAALGTAAFAAARKVEAIARTGIKDPETSAYTFAYFGDVAGREIDRAARHGRRFTLLTVGLDVLSDATGGRAPDELIELRRSVTDAILVSVRDSDVVARVEDDELYVLLPETGLLGALAARHRVLENLRAVAGVGGADPAVGIAVYPADGADLGRLLRVSRRRAERSRRGVWRRLGLSRCSFWDAVDRLLGGEDDAGLGRDGTVALHADLRAAHDDSALARHAAFPAALVPRVAATVASDAVSHALAGSLYVAGDSALASAVARVVDAVDRPALRAWALGPRPGTTEAAARIHLAVDDPRLEERTLVLSLTELGGYALLARPLGEGTLLAYHSSDLDLVDGLVRAVRATYHLQPEVR